MCAFLGLRGTLTKFLGYLGKHFRLNYPNFHNGCIVVPKFLRLAVSDANQATIKKAWKKLAAANHPDKIGRDSDDSVFVEASEAYRILSDPNELREWQIKQNEFGDGGFHRQHQRRWHQQQQQQQYMHQQQYMRQQHREWYEQQQRQRFVAEHPFGEHRSRAYLEPRTVEQLATFAGSQRPVLTMYLVPHGTYIRPDMWKALTDPLVGTGVEIGVVDAGFSPGAFLSHRGQSSSLSPCGHRDTASCVTPPPCVQLEHPQLGATIVAESAPAQYSTSGRVKATSRTSYFAGSQAVGVGRGAGSSLGRGCLSVAQAL